MWGEEGGDAALHLASRWLTVDRALGRRTAENERSTLARDLDPDPGPGRDPARGPDPASTLAADRALASALDLAPTPALALAPNPAFAPALELVAVDADFAARYFTADPSPGKLAGHTVVLPFVAAAELATWPERLLWGHSRAEDLSRWTDPGRVIAGDETVARIWARITVAAERAGSRPPANDTWTAASCLSYGLPLATLDKRQYRYFADRYGLQLI